MRVPKDDVPVVIDVPGATARQAEGFGDASGFGPLAGEYLSLGAGTDIAPLLQGLDGDACQAPHWGYLISGEIVVTYTNGVEETCRTHDLFHWPPGHCIRVVDDAEFILFSPHKEHAEVMDHMVAKMAGG
jgi:hypothetical protein